MVIKHMSMARLVSLGFISCALMSVYFIDMQRIKSSLGYLIHEKDVCSKDDYQHSIYLDSDGYLRSVLSPNLRWCDRNPFLKLYNQEVISNLEKKWMKWKEQRLKNTFQVLKNYAFHEGDWGGGMVYLAYPPSLPLPCPYPNNLTRIGGIHDGNKVLCGIELMQSMNNCVVYSLGSFNNFNFEYDLLQNTSCHVYTYDCTSTPPVSTIDRLNFYKICLGDPDLLLKFMFPYQQRILDIGIFNNTKFEHLDTLMKKNQHEEVHLLKMDIEGSEYSVFTSLINQSKKVNLPYQISFESHWWDRDIYHGILHQAMFEQLWTIGYRILQHEYNPSDHTCVEWTMMRIFC